MKIAARAAELAIKIDLDYLSEIKIEIEKMKLIVLKNELYSIEKMLKNNFLKSYQINALVAKKLEIIDKINLLNKRDLIFYLLFCRVFVYNENIKII